jgi:hypothetical protein
MDIDELLQMMRTNAESGRINLIDDRLRKFEAEFLNTVTAFGESMRQKSPMTISQMKEVAKTREGIDELLTALQGMGTCSTVNIDELSAQIITQVKKDRIKETQKMELHAQKKKATNGKIEEESHKEVFEGWDSDDDLEHENDKQKDFFEEFEDTPRRLSNQATLTQMTQGGKKKAMPGLSMLQIDKKVKGKGVGKYV